MTGCSCGPADPIVLLPDASVAIPVPTEDNAYTCRCICEVPIAQTTMCAPWAPERLGRSGGPNDGQLICEVSRAEQICFPPELNPNHVPPVLGAHVPTNAELFADCGARIGRLAEEAMRQAYRFCGRPSPDGSCPTSVCQIECQCGAVLAADGNVQTTSDAKCNNACPEIPFESPEGGLGNVNEATFVTAPNWPECPIAMDTPAVCRPPQLDPPDEPPDGLLGGLFGPATGEVTAGVATLALDDGAPTPTSVEGTVRFDLAACGGPAGCDAPLSLALRAADADVSGVRFSGMTAQGAAGPPGVRLDADGRGEVAPGAFFLTARGSGSVEILGVRVGETRAYFVPNPSPMTVEVDRVARTFAIDSAFDTITPDGMRLRLALQGSLDALPPTPTPVPTGRSSAPRPREQRSSSTGAAPPIPTATSSRADGRRSGRPVPSPSEASSSSTSSSRWAREATCSRSPTRECSSPRTGSPWSCGTRRGRRSARRPTLRACGHRTTSTSASTSAAS